jgi:NIPSNAP
MQRMQTSTRQPQPRVVELRRYTLHPGRRDDLVRLFEREFVETQQALGLQVLATFIDPARPDTFVWLRGFASMAERLQGLQAFYGGPVWQRHRDEANATMIDSDDVLLLRPITPWPLIQAASPSGHWHLLVCALREPADDALRAALRGLPGIWLDSEPSENDFPRLPVRSGSWLLGLAPTPPGLPPALQACLYQPAERLALTPTPRSHLR